MTLIRKISALMLMAAFVCSAVFAEGEVKTKARVDIEAPNGVKLTVYKKEVAPGSYVSNQTWHKDQELKDARAFFQTSDIADDKWHDYKFSFSADQDTKVKLFFRGAWVRDKETKKLNELWVYYDMIVAEGAEIKNGDFEEKDEKKGTPAGWIMSDKNLYVVGGDIPAASGKAMVYTWIMKPVAQTIDVKAGQKVTITMKIKAGEVVLAKDSTAK